ncbi:MAG TPA: hypothetical protein VNF71_15195 [Acidimicrobiales bacterium]|nr:hypothetical protein [Acidimicrobiales bacterium]
MTSVTVILTVLVGLDGCSQPVGNPFALTNLTSALTEANALYQAGGKAFTSGVTGVFSSSAPEFAWTDGACGATPSNCISYRVYSAVKDGDDQSAHAR